ncbi:hypothetical protein BgiBS90_017614, partial [Biomphalaria glabrata]
EFESKLCFCCSDGSIRHFPTHSLLPGTPGTCWSASLFGSGINVAFVSLLRLKS